ncbi:HPr family phosphocarrier protein [Caproiciproducens sp.]
MKHFEYMITDPIGIHARPAGLLAKAAKALNSVVTVGKPGTEPVAASRLMALMSMGIKHGDTVTVTVDGGDEDTNFQLMKRFFEENL